MFNHHCIKGFWFHGGPVFGHKLEKIVKFMTLGQGFLVLE